MVISLKPELSLLAIKWQKMKKKKKAPTGNTNIKVRECCLNNILLESSSWFIALEKTGQEMTSINESSAILH